jgi:hypothetical protein
VPVECGVALHLARGSTVDVHVAQLATPRGPCVQKSFDTTSAGIDLLHRMEKLVHALPGTNIVLSREFVDALRAKPPNLVRLGTRSFRGHPDPVELFLIPSDRLTEAELKAFVGP